MPKKPYLITLEYPPERGGVGRYLHSLAAVSNEELQVIVPMARAMSAEDPDAIIAQMFRNSWPRWWPIVKLCRGLKEQASCILISHVLPVGTAAMISRWTGGPPYVLLFHGLDLRLIKKSSWKRFLVKRIISSASGLVVNSRVTERELRELVGPTRTIEVITPGVTPLAVIPHDRARERLGIPTNESIILAVGRLVERKGFDMLIRAASHLPTADHVRIVIIGDGPEAGDLEKLAEHAPHPVQFISRASDAHVAEWYAAADVFCLPIKDHPDDLEGFGIVFLEASFAALPVVAGKAGGVEEAVVDRETGLLVNGSDPREIARALVLLLGDGERRKQLGEAGRIRVLRDFRWEDRWMRFKKLFDSIV
jgi:phosphatidylinositol alpha-1,6-mannosyltransferase